MANDLPQVGAEAILETDSYNKSINDALKRADKLDARLDDLSGAADIKVNVDDSEIAMAASMLLQLEDDASVKVDVDDAEIVSANSLVDAIGSDDPSVTVQVEDSELLAADRLLEGMEGDDPDVTVQVNDDEAEQTADLLRQIRDLSVINIVMDIPQKAIDFLDKIPGLQALADQMGASTVLDASLPQGLAGGEQIVSDLYTQGFGESREAVARFVAMLANIGTEEANIKPLATDLFEAQTAIEAITGTEPDMATLLARVQDLQSLGFADSFEDATDIIVAGFQSSIGLGGDFLGDLGEFAPTFATMGFTSEQMLATLNTGLAGGVDNISRMSEGLISFNENASQSNPNFIDALKAIDEVSDIDLGAMFKDFQEGDVTGADFMASVLEGARTYAQENGMTAAQGILGNIFGGTASNIGAQALLSIDPNAEGFATIEDRAQQASDTVRKSFETAVTELQRTIEDEVANTLDETFDLTARLELAKQQFHTFIDELKSGKSVGEAIEVAFGIEGVDTALSNIQRIFGQFVIALLEIVATIQDPLGVNNNDDAARAQIKTLATQQLPFDIKLANPEELDTIFSQAAKRGVTDLGGALTTALDELVAEGDFDQVQAIIGELVSNPEVSPEAAKTLATKYEKLIADAQAAMKPPPETEGWWNNLKPPSDALEKTLTKGTSGGASRGDGWWTSLTPPPEAADAVKTWWDNLKPPEDSEGGLLGNITSDVDNAITKITDLDTTTATATENTATSWDNLNISLTEDAAAITATLEAAAAKTEEYDTRVAESLTGNTVTASFDAVLARAAADFPAVDAFLDGTIGRVQQLDLYSKAAAISLGGLAAGVKVFPVAKLEQIVTLATAFAGAQNIVNNDNSTKTVNVTNNNSNGAQTSNSDYELGQNLGGG